MQKKFVFQQEGKRAFRLAAATWEEAVNEAVALPLDPPRNGHVRTATQEEWEAASAPPTPKA